MGNTTRFIAALCLLAGAAGVSIAQQYPAKPIRLILGFGVGSALDTGARLIGPQMSKQLGQPIVVDNRLGAGGTIAAKAAVAAPPDGYTLFFGNTTLINPVLIKTNAVDAGRELTAISNCMSGAYLFYTSGKLPVNSLKELVAHAKASPSGRMNFASTASTVEVLMHMLRRLTGVTFTVIPYSSNTQIVTALVAGEADFTFSVISGFASPLQENTIKALFVAAPKRLTQLPNVPTAGELGIDQFEASVSNFGLWAPLGTPRELINKLSSEAVAAVQRPDVAEQIRKISYEPVGSTPEKALADFNAAIKFWSEAAREANFVPQ